MNTNCFTFYLGSDSNINSYLTVKPGFYSDTTDSIQFGSAWSVKCFDLKCSQCCPKELSVTNRKNLNTIILKSTRN